MLPGSPYLAVQCKLQKEKAEFKLSLYMFTSPELSNAQLMGNLNLVATDGA